jgi:CheY-like chemotaxis protein
LSSRCFRRIGLPFPLPVLQRPDDAKDYLEGSGAYADRRTSPLPTLVIAELELRGGSGFELLNWIRSRPACSHLLFFVLTTSTRVEDVDRAVALGADHYYVKPLGVPAWSSTLRSLALLWRRLFERARRSAAP